MGGFRCDVQPHRIRAVQTARTRPTRQEGTASGARTRKGQLPPPTLAPTGLAEHAQQGGPNLQAIQRLPALPATEPHPLMYTSTASREDSATREQDHPNHTQEHDRSAPPPTSTPSTTTPEAGAGTGGGGLNKRLLRPSQKGQESVKATKAVNHNLVTDQVINQNPT